MPKPVARLTTPSQMVAALPLQLGFVPTESIVVVCCHEPRGRMGLTLRFDLPAAEHEQLLAEEIERRVRHQVATRVLLAVYTSQPDGGERARLAFVDGLRERFQDLVVTEAVLVRDDRFWSYLCAEQRCCPDEGRPVDDARESSSIRLLEAETVLQGRTVLADRDALQASLAGPVFLAGQVARQRCDGALTLYEEAVAESGKDVTAGASLSGWEAAIARYRTPPTELGDLEAAALAVSLRDVWVRDQIAAAPSRDLPAIRLLLEDLVRKTPSPHDAPVCALFAWLAYCEGGGAVVSIALERALGTDPTYTLALLLQQAILAQVQPKQLRKLTRRSRGLERWAA